MNVAERGSGRMTYAKKIKPFAEHDLRVTLQRAGKYSYYEIGYGFLVFRLTWGAFHLAKISGPTGTAKTIFKKSGKDKQAFGDIVPPFIMHLRAIIFFNLNKYNSAVLTWYTIQ